MLTPAALEGVRADLAVFRAVGTLAVPVTPAVVNGVWQWFADVDLPLPLPVMDMDEDERRRLSLDILGEMDHTFRRLLHRVRAHTANIHATPGAPYEMTAADHEDVATVDRLWRELAGCYAPLLNAQVPVIPAEHRTEVHRSAADALMAITGLDRDDLRTALRENGRMRLNLRRQGLDPDLIG